MTAAAQAVDHADKPRLAIVGNDQATALARVKAEAAVLFEEATPDETVRAYRSDWKFWVEFTTERELPPYTADTDVLAVFAQRLIDRPKVGRHDDGKPISPAAVERRLYGVVACLRQRLGVLAVPLGLVRGVEDVIAKYMRELADADLPTGRGKANPMLPSELILICQTAPDTMLGQRDKILLIIAFCSGMRRSELSRLRRSDVVDNGSGLTITIRYGKGCSKSRTVYLSPASNPEVCSVRQWRLWMTLSDTLPADAVKNGAMVWAFPRLNRHGHFIGQLSGQSVAVRITEAGQRAGIAVRFTGHSTRRGHVTAAFDAGHDAATIGQNTGQTEPTVRAYREHFERAAKNSSQGLLGGALAPPRVIGIPLE